MDISCVNIFVNISLTKNFFLTVEDIVRNIEEKRHVETVKSLTKLESRRPETRKGSTL